jgi:hypothetical protein
MISLPLHQSGTFFWH